MQLLTCLTPMCDSYDSSTAFHLCRQGFEDTRLETSKAQSDTFGIHLPSPACQDIARWLGDAPFDSWSAGDRLYQPCLFITTLATQNRCLVEPLPLL